MIDKICPIMSKPLPTPNLKGNRTMKTLITTKVEKMVHKKIMVYSLQAGQKRGERMSLIEAYCIVLNAGLKALKAKNKSKKS